MGYTEVMKEVLKRLVVIENILMNDFGIVCETSTDIGGIKVHLETLEMKIDRIEKELGRVLKVGECDPNCVSGD